MKNLWVDDDPKKVVLNFCKENRKFLPGKSETFSYENFSDRIHDPQTKVYKYVSHFILLLEFFGTVKGAPIWFEGLGYRRS